MIPCSTYKKWQCDMIIHSDIGREKNGQTCQWAQTVTCFDADIKITVSIKLQIPVGSQIATASVDLTVRESYRISGLDVVVFFFLSYFILFLFGFFLPSNLTRRSALTWLDRQGGKQWFLTCLFFNSFSNRWINIHRQMGK